MKLSPEPLEDAGPVGLSDAPAVALDARRRWPLQLLDAQNLVPLLEGVGLALLVFIVLWRGGETVRASYHGYIHATIGNAVLREGLVPENPYHAGSPLRYYTLYPLLGVLLGRFGPGPLWGFSSLSVIAAFLFPLAMDRLGTALEMSFRARRCALAAAVLGFGALGWVLVLFSAKAPAGSPPVFALSAMIGAGHAWQWDPRNAAFLNKFLNATSFGISIPFGLWAMAVAARPGARARGVVLPAALTLALNPAMGMPVVLCVAGWKLPALLRGTWPQRLAWPAAGGAAVLAALPFLLSLANPTPEGVALYPARLVGHPLANLLGPVAFLLVPGLLGLRAWGRRLRSMWLWAAFVPALLLVAVHLDGGNETYFARFWAVLWALPAGVWAGGMLVRARLRVLPPLLALLALPTQVLVVAAYFAWGTAHPIVPIEDAGGRLALRPEFRDPVLPPSVLSAEAGAERKACVLVPPSHRALRMSQGVVQGNPLAPLLSHPLVVDLPHFQNQRESDLQRRLDLVRTYWTGDASARPDALRQLRALFPGRPMLVISWLGEDEARILRAQDARLLAETEAVSLWRLPPPPP